MPRGSSSTRSSTIAHGIAIVRVIGSLPVAAHSVNRSPSNAFCGAYCGDDGRDTVTVNVIGGSIKPRAALDNALTRNPPTNAAKPASVIRRPRRFEVLRIGDLR